MSLLPISVDPDLAERVLFYVYRTEAKRVPRRVVLKRAVRKFGLSEAVIRQILRDAKEAQSG